MENIENKVSGRILHKESGEGIPNLIVEVFDIDPHSFNPDLDGIYVTPNKDLRKEDFKAKGGQLDAAHSQPQARQELPADRLGSVITDENGNFEISYMDDAFQVRKKKIVAAESPLEQGDDNKVDLRPDLFLVVTAPEETGVEAFSNVVYRSNWARVNAGRSEEYLIRITSEVLANAGLPLPEGFLPPEQEPGVRPNISIEPPLTYKEQLENSIQTTLQRKEDAKGVYHEFLKREREASQQKKEQFLKPFNASISQIEPGVRHSALFVDAGQSVEAKTIDNIKKGLKLISEANGQAGRQKVGIIFLSDEEANELGIDPEADFTQLEGDQNEQFNEKRAQASDGVPDFVRIDMLEKFCRAKTAPEQACANIFTEEMPDDTPNSDNEEEIPPADGKKEVQDYISNQMDKAAAPEDPVQFGSHVKGFQERNRADQEVIGSTISALRLQQGPADTPAFYDFHHVQIAFEHIWQEVLDQDIIGVAEKLYDEIVDIGGEVIESSYDGIVESGKLVSTFINQTIGLQVPNHIHDNFNIKSTVWEAFDKSTRGALTNLSKEISSIKEAINILWEMHDFPDMNKIYWSKEERIKRFMGLIGKLKNNPKIGHEELYKTKGLA